MTINLLTLAEWAGAIAAIAGVLSLFYRKVDKALLSPVKMNSKNIEDLISWNMKQQMDIVENRECSQELILAVRACLDGHIQQGCNGKVTKAAADLDAYILARSADMKSYGGNQNAK